eukprot:SAG22_NODE_1398_length_4507_cov_9.035617_3_plen_75_part_00
MPVVHVDSNCGFAEAAFPQHRLFQFLTPLCLQCGADGLVPSCDVGSDGGMKTSKKSRKKKKKKKKKKAKQKADL